MNISHRKDADNSSRRPASRRTSSFPPSSPPSMSFSHGIPFSWEQQPGIPKHQSDHQSPTTVSVSVSSKGGGSHQDLMLPPPPAAAPSTNQKKKFPPMMMMDRDPFMAALMECSKDLGVDHELEEKYQYRWKGAKVSRSLSDRFGSCKRDSCSVTDSTILLQKPNRPAYYQLLDRRSR